MGYSNNKWRKILIILAIINLCFILFAKITKSFGDFTISNELNGQTFNINDNFINKYPYYCFCTTSDGENMYVICSNSPITTSSTNSDEFGYYNYFNPDNTGMGYFAGYYGYIQTTLNGNSLPDIEKSLNRVTANSFGAMRVFYTNHDIKNSTSGNVIIENSEYFAPYFENITEIEAGYPDGVFIRLGDYSKDDNLYFHLLKVNSSSVSTPR